MAEAALTAVQALADDVAAEATAIIGLLYQTDDSRKAIRLVEILNRLDGQLFAAGGHEKEREMVDNCFHFLLGHATAEVREAVGKIHPD